MQIGKITLFAMLIFHQQNAIAAELVSRLTNMKCDFNSYFATNLTCSMKAYGRTNVTSEFSIDVLREVPSVFMHFKLFKFYNQFRPFLIDHVFDLCQIIRGTFSAFYASVVTSSVRETNFLDECPYVKKHYYAKGVYLDGKILERLPDMAGDYRADFSFHDGKNRHIGKISYSLTLSYKPSYKINSKRRIPNNRTQAIVSSVVVLNKLV